MKQICTTAPKTSIIRDIAEPICGENQIKIRTKYVGVCMSEHYAWATCSSNSTFGHEPMGVVVEVGAAVDGFSVGDHVSGMWGSTLPGGGGMVEFAVANPTSDILVKLPNDVRDEDYVLEPLACIMSAVSKVKMSMPGTRVCVVGCGYMGCGAIGLLKLRGAWVTAVDIRSECLQDAKRYGADEILTPDAALELYRDSFVAVMEWGETSESLDVSINLTSYCGAVYVGGYHTGGKRLVDMQQLNIKAIDCLSVHPRERELSDIGARNCVELLRSGRWNYTGIPTKIYPVTMFDLAQEELETKYGHYMKALIDMTADSGEPRIV